MLPDSRARASPAGVFALDDIKELLPQMSSRFVPWGAITAFFRPTLAGLAFTPPLAASSINAITRPRASEGTHPGSRLTALPHASSWLRSAARCPSARLLVPDREHQRFSGGFQAFGTMFRRAMHPDASCATPDST